MRLRELQADNDAVSPVIGVILMVAITVILAAVIASFVFGLGASADEVQPNTSFAFDYDNESTPGGNVTVTFSDGEALDADEVFFRGENLTGGEQSYSDVGSGDEWAAGQSIEIDVADSDYVLNVVWESPDSDSSSTLQTDRGPDA